MAPRWRAAAALALVGGLALVSYTWHLTRNGWGNIYYAGIAVTGGRAPGAGFFGSLEPMSVVSTDKPPLALWMMMLSVRLLGAHPLAVLLPQVLETVAAVVVLGWTVRRVAGTRAGVVAAVVLAASPVVFALARFDDPDTLLLLASVVAAHAVVRVAEDGRRRWLVLLGAALGAAFLTKWLAGLVIVPAVLWALWSPVRGRRVRSATTAGASFVVTGLWWVATLALLGPGHRPTADASGGSLVELVLGSNGLARLSGAGADPVSGHPGALRLLVAPFDDQTAWFLPAALLSLVLLLLDRETHPARRVAVRLLGGWLVVAVALFSTMGGAMHPYYTSYLAPPAAGLLGLAAARVGRGWPAWRAVALVVVTGATGCAVLAATGRSLAWLAVPTALAAVVGAVLLLLLRSGGWAPRAGAVALVAVAAAGLTGPLATDWVTAHVVVNGADPRAGWRQAGTTAVPPAALVAFLRAHPVAGWAAAVPQASPAAELELASGLPVLPLGGFTGSSASPSLGQLRHDVALGRLRYVVLTGKYVTDPTGTPASLLAHPVAAMVDWARATGCPLRVGPVTVIDLTDRACHATSAPR
jgi:4-amino-4-deoxy-L-arabinose transferase-like glycosyltransferase